VKDKELFIRLLLEWIIIAVIALGLFMLFLRFYVEVPWKALMNPEITWK